MHAIHIVRDSKHSCVCHRQQQQQKHAALSMALSITLGTRDGENAVVDWAILCIVLVYITWYVLYCLMLEDENVFLKIFRK